MPTDSMFGLAYLNPQQNKSIFQLSPTGDYAQTDFSTYTPEPTASNYVLSGAGTPAQNNSLFNNIKSIFTNPDGSMNWNGAGAIASGIGSIFNAYNQGQYQNKMADLYRQQYAMQKAQQDRANQRQDLAQANYNKAMGV